ncbi:Nop14-like protein [Ramaria rubella]|nr:Nop14-like protein [Ramaria rubella]
MAKGSQLVQLKSALSEAGLSRQSQPKWSGKKRKRSGAAVAPEKDKDRAAKKLREIHERLNPFDVKVTKLKHDVGGRKLKGVTGRPGLSKQAGIEQRKKTLLVEYEQKNHSGGIVDRRFGENNPTVTPEERMLERFTRERQRASKGMAFNLEDEDDLTHYGQSLSAMDDFDGVGLGLEDNEQDNGQIDGETVGRSHFGGFEDDDDDAVDHNDGGEPSKKKSKAEVMAEVIAKSKEHKYQRQMEKEEDENTRFQLDQEFDAIRGLLFDGPGSSTTGSNAVPLGRARPAPPTADVPIAAGDHEYDQFVRELAFEKRAQPKDRTKTEEELAMEEKESLEKAERARLRRMMGIDDNSEDEETQTGRKRKRNRGGDDLDDDEDMLDGLGAGLVGKELQSRDKDNTGSGSEDEDTEPSREDEEEFDNRDDSELGEFRKELNDTSPDPSLQHKEGGQKHWHAKNQDLPFTFLCPASHDEFLSILEDIDDCNLSTVVQRIRSLHHPSLSKENAAKLQVFISVLVDHLLHVATPPTPKFSLLGDLVPHIYALTQTYPVAAAQTFVEKLSLMRKNLARGLTKGAKSLDSKTWPGTAELALLRVLGVVWSTSDMNHAVVSAARVLMGSYLGLCRIRSTADLASGLFLCTLFLQYEELSKRIIPEAINFLSNTVLHLAPHSFETPELIPGSFPVPDLRDASNMLKINATSTQGLQTTHPDLTSILCDGNSSPQHRLNLLGMALQLLGNFAELYKSLDGFIELYAPVLDILQGVILADFPSTLQHRHSNLQGMILRLLKFAGLARRPLALQAHKPIPIPSYVPKFSATSSNFLRKQDPDLERAAAAKLRNQVKQERKGAIRELRKDSRFLAGVQQKRQMEEANAYKARMKSAFGSLEGERAEQRALDREKAREKKRSGRK